MKRFSVFVGVAAFLLPSVASGQLAIEVGERREPVFYSDSQFVITLNDTLASAETISQLNMAGLIKSDAEPTPWGNGFWVIDVDDAVPMNEATAIAGSIPNVLCAKPLELDELGRPYNVTDMIIVRYANAAPTDLESDLAELYGLEFIDQMRTRSDTKAYALGRASCDRTIEVSNSINALPAIVWSEPVYAVQFKLEYEPNDSLWPMQWNFKNIAQYAGLPDADIDLDLAWDVTFGDSNVIIAVIDDGINWHQDFSLAVIDSGYDFVGEHYYTPVEDNNPSPGYYRAHGMGCAGLIAGATDTTVDRYGLAGISPKCTIIPIKVFDDDGEGLMPPYYFLAADAIYYAMNRGAMIINCSWSIGYSRIEVIASAIDSAVYHNPNGQSCLFVCAAGTASKLGVVFPANMENTLAVTATDDWDHACYWAAYGAEVDVAAPSSRHMTMVDRNFLSLDQTYLAGINPTFTDPYFPESETWMDWTQKFGGTSASTAEVSGIAALILARRPDFVSDTMYEMLRYVLEGSAEDEVGDEYDTPGWDQYYGHGRVNAYRALLSVIRGDVNNDGATNPVDVVLMVNFVYKNQGCPEPEVCVGDCDCTGSINPVDVVCLVNWVYKSDQGYPPPAICFNYMDLDD